MATLTSEIDCSAHTTREINQAIKRAAADGVPEIRLTNPAARHCLGVAVMSPIHVIFDGPVGWYCGGMSDGGRHHGQRVVRVERRREPDVGLGRCARKRRIVGRRDAPRRPRVRRRDDRRAHRASR